MTATPLAFDGMNIPPQISSTCGDRRGKRLAETGTQGLLARFRHRVGADDLGSTVGKLRRKHKLPGIVEIVSKDREAHDSRAVEGVPDQNDPVGHRIGADEETALEV